MPEKPSNLTYGVDDKIPLPTLAMLGLQHLCVCAITLIFPVVIVNAFGGTRSQTDFLIDMTLMGIGVGSILQGIKRGPVGSGYLCPQVAGPSYFSASVMAGSMGGIPLVLGMTMIAGVFESLFSRVLPKMRMLFPTEVTGLIVAMVGITIIPTAAHIFLGWDHEGQSINYSHLWVGVLTLALMVALNVYSKGKVRLFCIIIGMAAGYLASIPAGLFTPELTSHLLDSSWLAFPFLEHPGWSFDAALILPMCLATLCSSLKTVGDLTTCQKINDQHWKRPDMKNVQQGVLADGLGCFCSGLVGGLGMSTSSTNIGLSIATGATSRYINLSLGAIAILAAFSPKLASIFTIMPPPVMGATLFFALTFMIVAGFQMVMSRLLDARKTFVIGLATISGLMVDILPGAFEHLPDWLSPVFSSALSTAAVTAILLNLALRIGIKRKVELVLQPEAAAPQQALDFLRRNGAAWAARKEIIDKSGDTLSELLEALVLHDMALGEIHLQAAFDELNLDISVEYDGEALEISEKPPEAEALINDQHAHRILAGFLIGQYADKISLSQIGGRQLVRLQFTH